VIEPELRGSLTRRNISHSEHKYPSIVTATWVEPQGGVLDGLPYAFRSGPLLQKRNGYNDPNHEPRQEAADCIRMPKGNTGSLVGGMARMGNLTFNLPY
jgi:hypothetical protein